MIVSRNPSGEDGKSGEVFQDEATNKKIHQHLSDKTDVISEQDIKNVRTDFPETATEEIPSAAGNTETLPGESGGAEDNEEPAKNEEIEETKEDEHPIITPWNILGS